jgi:hypothetical protein
VVIAKSKGDFFSRAQLKDAADFVAERGGGLLVLGGRSFAQKGLSATPLEEVLPVELSDRRGGLVRASLPEDLAAHNRPDADVEGEAHPIMRSAPHPTKPGGCGRRCRPLAASAPLGGPRPGATVLALTKSPDGGVFPLGRRAALRPGALDGVRR